VAITIKKKTLKLKSDAEPSTSDTEEQVTPEAPDDLVVAAVMPAKVPVAKSGASFAPFAIMGLIACALLGVLLAIQLIENSFYTGSIPRAGAVVSR
jgi:hypothetical protein